MIDTIAATVLDRLIDVRLAALERRVRADIAATGPEDAAALDVPPDPAADWHRITVEELLQLEREHLKTWRDGLLEVFA